MSVRTPNDGTRPQGAVPPLAAVASLSLDDGRLLVDSVADYAIYMLDAGGHVASWNLGAEKIKGYRADEIIGEHVSKFYSANDVAAGKAASELASALELGRTEYEGWRVRKDGTPFWANVVTIVLRSESGELRGFARVTKDLTQRRLAEEKLRQSEARFHHLVDAVTEYAIYMLDPTGHVTTWNAGARKAKGYAPDEIIGKHFSVFYTPEDRAAGKPERILETVRREHRFDEESWRIRKDGTLFWASVSITAIRNEAGEVTAFAKVTRDLSERRATDESLRRSEERFRLLLESITDYAIYTLDPQGSVTTWNLGAERMKGYLASEAVGMHFSAFFPSEDVRAGKPERELAAAEAHGRFEDEGWRIRKDGSRFWANVIITPLRDAKRTLVGFGKVTRDLTARRQAEETERGLLREQAARVAAESVANRAAEANRIKDEFLATVSHELRTPLNAIVGWASMLRQRQLEPKLAKGIEVIHRNAHAQVKIVEDILDVSRIVTGKLHLEPVPTDLVAVVNEAMESVRHAASAKQIAMEFAPSVEVCPIIGDPDRLRQAAWNILSNAVKFTEAGGFVRITLQQVGLEVTLTFADTGQGIEPDFLPFVFDRFKQADATTTRRFGGLGLGLALVRHIIELHGGSVAVSSGGGGKGSTFFLTLPVRATLPHTPPARPIPMTIATKLRESRPLKGLRILLVDDDVDANELLSEVLADAGASVENASSAARGFDALRRFRPHILVSDIGMPEEDGYSLLRRIRALDMTEGGGIPSIALTAYTRSEDRTKALAAGFTTHVGKPVNPDDLVAAIANLASFVPH